MTDQYYHFAGAFGKSIRTKVRPAPGGPSPAGCPHARLAFSIGPGAARICPGAARFQRALPSPSPPNCAFTRHSPDALIWILNQSWGRTLPACSAVAGPAKLRLYPSVDLDFEPALFQCALPSPNRQICSSTCQSLEPVIRILKKNGQRLPVTSRQCSFSRYAIPLRTSSGPSPNPDPRPLRYPLLGSEY
jgi:hypothetical protein